MHRASASTAPPALNPCKVNQDADLALGVPQISVLCGTFCSQYGLSVSSSAGHADVPLRQCSTVVKKPGFGT